MLRVLMAGWIGGVVLVAWSAVFLAFGPAGSAGSDSALAGLLQERVGSLRRFIPFGPAEASAAGVPQAGESLAARPTLASVSLDPLAAAQGLGVACVAATMAAVLMSLIAGKQKAFADRVIVAVLLGVFASAAVLLPAGRWAEFSAADAMPLVGEVVVGWLLAGMVMAVVLRPQPRRARA